MKRKNSWGLTDEGLLDGLTGQELIEILTLAIMDCLALLLEAFSHLQSCRPSAFSIFAMSPVSSSLFSLVAILRAFAARLLRAVLLLPFSSFTLPSRSASLR